MDTSPATTPTPGTSSWLPGRGQRAIQGARRRVWLRACRPLKTKRVNSSLRSGSDHHTISVVIPNLDGAHWLEGCLRTLTSGDAQPFEVIVADDGSTDASRVVSHTFGARFVDAPRPRTGFATTANRGIRAATGEWILLLNNDTEVSSTAISALTTAMKEHPSVAMIAPLVLSLRDRESIDSAGMLIFPDATARPRWHGEKISTKSPRLEEVLVPSGAAALFRSSWLERVGLLDEGMTSYLEDIDLGLRVRRVGGVALFVPGAVIFHYFSGTTGALSPTKARFIERNHTTVAARHLPLHWLLLLPVWTVIRWGVLAKTVLRSRAMPSDDPSPPVRETIAAVLRGLVEGIVRLPRSLRERRLFRQHATVGARDWRALLAAHRAHIGDYERFGA